jgi:hypothetical protein
MDIKELIAPAIDWTDQTWAQRLDMAASVLFLHGYITQSQRAKIADKMNAQFQKAIDNGEIVERPQ